MWPLDIPTRSLSDPRWIPYPQAGQVPAYRLRCRAMSTLCALLTVVAVVQASAHDKPYWKGIVDAKFEVPAGETAPRLAGELVRDLGSPDPEMRDDLAITILTAWIYDRKLLSADDLRPLSRTLQEQLRPGIATAGSDAVLGRSFSALALSIVAARENATPFMTQGEYAGLLASALAYFRDERHTRGYDA